MSHSPKWQFWIDRGGTFTDVVARAPDGRLITEKLLSDDPDRYADATVAGVRRALGLGDGARIPLDQIAGLALGTTLATNALLERRGEPPVLAITKGFGDALRIGYQTRPRIFALRIILPDMIYAEVIEVQERIDAQGTVIAPLDLEVARRHLGSCYARGRRSIAIVLMHSYRYPTHERQLAELAREIGFTQISVSHELSPLMKLIGRGDTTVADAYLSPIMQAYVRHLREQLVGVRLLFMQSNGGLVDAVHLHGKDAVLSGPAGGVIGAVRMAETAGYHKLIGFDMGGTSTDVWHYSGEFKHSFDTELAGIRLRVPMLKIHSIAAGGGSILHFDGLRCRVGPDSAGAHPGPACYRRGGPLTITDCNVLLGKIQAKFFPSVFGPQGDEPLDAAVVRQKFDELARTLHQATGDDPNPMTVAEGFIDIAVTNMAKAIKQVSVRHGYDVTRYTLCCFGGAGGQHACRVADALGIETVLIHPQAGVLSALGMGLADLTVMREQAIEKRLEAGTMSELTGAFDALSKSCRAILREQGSQPSNTRVIQRVYLRYEGTDMALPVPYGAIDPMRQSFDSAYRQRFGVTIPDRALIVEAIAVEAHSPADELHHAISATPVSLNTRRDQAQATDRVILYCGGCIHDTPVFRRIDLAPGSIIASPAIIAEDNATTVVELGWQAQVTPRYDLVLTRVVQRAQRTPIGTRIDPVLLEIVNSAFMDVAEQMGTVLANTATSVNIKERLDFSCALFDQYGQLIANAPHLPVHLGSMGDSVEALMQANMGCMQPGDVYMLNNPYQGGTHLPDITVVTPIFDDRGDKILFFVGTRGHHADIGGITPGSMPPSSRHIDEEGVLIDNFLLVREGRLREDDVLRLLVEGRYPARNPRQNLADLRAMVAANMQGMHALRQLVKAYDLPAVQAYMQHVQDNAEESVRRVIAVLKDGDFSYPMDNGAVIRVAIRTDRQRRCAVIDFTGSSPQRDDNFNAPIAICRAAVIYVFRSLVDDDIPLNAGCMKPLKLIVPEGLFLNPRYPAAVVAGNVEISQCITDALYGALGVMAAAQGTMNNFTFGNADYQYYETIAGGSGAGNGFDGVDCVQTHMTNTRITDPEILENRFPVRLESFAIRANSGGRGRYRGGNGAIRRVRFLETLEAAIVSNRRSIPPYGIAGGEPGARGRQWVERADGSIDTLDGCAQTTMHPGDVFVIETPGGGGYGPDHGAVDE